MVIIVCLILTSVLFLLRRFVLNSYESDDRIKPPDDDIGDDDPIEVQSWSRKVAMKLLFHITQ